MIALAVILIFRVEYADDVDLSSRIIYIQNRNRTPLSETDQEYLEALTNQIKVVPNDLYTIKGDVEMIEGQYTSYRLYSANLLFLEDVNGRLPENRNEIVCDISLYSIGDQVNMSYQGVVGQYTIVGLYRSIHSDYETNIYVHDALLRGSYDIIKQNILNYINDETPLVFYTSQGSNDLSLEITDQSQSILYIENNEINDNDFMTYQVGRQIGYIDNNIYQVVTESSENKLVLTKHDFENLFSSYIHDYEYIVRAKNRSDIELFSSMVYDSTYRIIDIYQSEQVDVSVLNNFLINVIRSLIFLGIVAVMTIIHKFIVKKYMHRLNNKYHYYQICGAKKHIIQWIVRCNFLLYVMFDVLLLVLIIITLNMIITDFNLINLLDVLFITIWILLATYFYINKGLEEVTYD